MVLPRRSPGQGCPKSHFKVIVLPLFLLTVICSVLFGPIVTLDSSSLEVPKDSFKATGGSFDSSYINGHGNAATLETTAAAAVAAAAAPEGPHGPVGDRIGAFTPDERQQSGPQNPTEPQFFGDSIAVVNEDDVAQDFTGQKEFEVDHFHSKPECSPIPSDQVSFTLTSQFSLDRIWIMKYQCERWPSPLPISIAVYLPSDSEKDENYIGDFLKNEMQCDLDRLKVTILKGSNSSSMQRYPMNILRNLAIEAVQSSHLVYIDADFLISDQLHQDLLAMAPIVGNDTKAAIVLPAFEYFTDCAGHFASQDKDTLACLESEWENAVPKKRNKLVRLLDRKWGTRPMIKEGFHGVRYHSSTMYKTWRNQSTPLRISCLKNDKYEPYLAVRLCRDLPEFPRMFQGYGWNKTIWIHWLFRKLGYRLWQIPNGFVLHLPHEDSVARKTFDDRNKNSTMVVNAPEITAYLQWFKSVPSHPDRLPTCEDEGKKLA